MAKKKEESTVFEVVVVLAIVAIVALTGQVLLHSERTGRPMSLGDTGITGFVAAGSIEEQTVKQFLDLAVESIEVNPPSPLISKPFSITVNVANLGEAEIDSPFYVEAELVPNSENANPTRINKAITQRMAPGDKASIVFDLALVTKEGPLKITARADSTFKLDDDNLANNVRSKTVIISI